MEQVESIAVWHHILEYPVGSPRRKGGRSILSKALRSGDTVTLAAQCVDALGTNEFYDRVLELLASTAEHSLAALVRYSRTCQPDLIIPRIEPTEAIMSYYRHFYSLDPFFIHWRNGGDIGVYRLRALAGGIGRSHYARDFLSPMAIYDEIAVFLPAIGEASPTLILDRKTGPFTETEVQRVRALFPLLASLHRRHLGVFIASGIDLTASPIGNERPLRLVDQSGAQVFATRAWVDHLERHVRILEDAIRQVEKSGPSAVSLGPVLQFRRTRLPGDFGPAPGGHCDEIIKRETIADIGVAAITGLPPSLAAQLTKREQDVALLTFQGYPVIEIASRLGLSRGTIKNYRLNIYRKLDITTERELFGEYIRALGGA